VPAPFPAVGTHGHRKTGNIGARSTGARAALEPPKGSSSLGTPTFVPSHFVPIPDSRRPTACPIVRTGAEQRRHPTSVQVSVGSVQSVTTFWDIPQRLGVTTGGRTAEEHYCRRLSIPSRRKVNPSLNWRGVVNEASLLLRSSVR
jgi:hypothetical protein